MYSQIVIINIWKLYIIVYKIIDIFIWLRIFLDYLKKFKILVNSKFIKSFRIYEKYYSINNEKFNLWSL